MPFGLSCCSCQVCDQKSELASEKVRVQQPIFADKDDVNQDWNSVGNAAREIGTLEEKNDVLSHHASKVAQALQDAGEVIGVHLELRDGMQIGLGMLPDNVNQVLRVELVRKSGLASEWNERHPDQKLEKGDEVFMVNSVGGDVRKMVEACSQARSFDFKVRKKMKT
mmetsp:Transcript_34807/g.92949  ORF Transcript_34807/g.92949 Transcript_34807/m.92949 type:complete len:167 (-) Transcript_34807:235-735(-)|eukprot:CAMPEP_0194488420 /NCGR_PEP_ID=MMETSP0253-20130528/8348_1 /TAXON_ID=2966 /ORGANISM="Noctiluca scintillans" /LENGTH=166 /DNA_ID=CAMNT_0039328783 /DNA_START=19 /DNA_END=519 /DNA_ORIENTATION=-